TGPEIPTLCSGPSLGPRLAPRPLVIDHAVPRRVPPYVTADEHVLAVDAFEPRRQGGEGGPRALVLCVGLELDADAAELLERVSHEQVLRLDVRAGSPRRRAHPRVADLEPAMLGRDCQIARAADRHAALQDRERIVGALAHQLEPAVDIGDAHPAPDLRVGAGRAQAVLVLRRERFERHEASLEPSWQLLPHGDTVSTLSKRCRSTSSCA